MHVYIYAKKAIRNHKFIEEKHLLDYPGECDLSAYVNFMSLASVAKKVDGSNVYFIKNIVIFL